MNGIVAGIDIGGSGIKACVVDDTTILAASSVPTMSETADGLADLAVSTVGTAMTEAGLLLADLDWIGIGVPGHVSDGIVRNAANLGIGESGFDLGGYVSSATQVPSLVENDMRVAAFGAYTQTLRVDPSIQNLVYVGLGTGVSAGVILDGRVFRGSRGLAGEFGHVSMDTGLDCACGSVGCLETVIGSAGLRQAWGETAASSLFGSAANGDPGARDLVKTMIDYLARAMWWLAATYDPDIFFIGGGITSNTPSIRALLAARWVEVAASSALARRVLDPDRIRLYDMEEPVGAYGAALLAAAHRDRSGQRHETANWEEEPIP